MAFTIDDAARLAAPCRVMGDLNRYERRQEELDEDWDETPLWEKFTSEKDVFDNYYADAATQHYPNELDPIRRALEFGDDAELGRQFRIILHAYIDECEEEG